MRFVNINVTATTDAEQINQNKVIAQSIEIPLAIQRADGSGCLIKSVALIDETNSTLECDVIFASASTAITEDEGKAVGEDVADLDSTINLFQGFVAIRSADYTDLIDSRLASKGGVDLVVSSAKSNTSIYCHVINRGSAVTFGETNDLKLRIGIQQ